MNQTTKTVFITGASRGIGRAIAIRFAAAGYRLALCCRHNSDMLRKLQTLITEQYHTDCLIYSRYRKLFTNGIHAERYHSAFSSY